MAFDINPFSRFRDTQRINFKGNDTFGAWERPEVFDNLTEDDIIKYVVEVGESGRPDLIAERFYSIAAANWIIIMFNQPLNTIGWPESNSVIDVPKKTAIGELL